jgi:hypothetical protein
MTPGRYRVDIVAYQMNEFGNQVLIDGVYPGLILEIVEKENDIIWLDRWWGHVRLNDLKISNKFHDRHRENSRDKNLNTIWENK